jgi:hypothetical protein
MAFASDRSNKGLAARGVLWRLWEEKEMGAIDDTEFRAVKAKVLGLDKRSADPTNRQSTLGTAAGARCVGIEGMASSVSLDVASEEGHLATVRFTLRGVIPVACDAGSVFSSDTSDGSRRPIVEDSDSDEEIVLVRTVTREERDASLRERGD